MKNIERPEVLEMIAGSLLAHTIISCENCIVKKFGKDFCNGNDGRSCFDVISEWLKSDADNWTE